MKRAIITGGTGGLGSAIAARLQEGAWEVISLGRKDLDLADDAAVNGFFERNECDLLVCAAGVIRDNPILRMGEDEWDEVFEVNYLAAARCAAATLSEMVVRGKGHVVFISSYAALHPAVGQAVYATAKAALLGLTKTLAEEHGPSGVRVNVVLPGFLDTPMTVDVSEKRREVVRDLHCLREFNTVAAAADFVWFLEERMPFTSGQVFQLDSRA